MRRRLTILLRHRSLCTAFAKPELTISPVATHAKIDIYKLELRHPLFESGHDKVFAAKLQGPQSIGSRAILTLEMSAERMGYDVTEVRQQADYGQVLTPPELLCDIVSFDSVQNTYRVVVGSRPNALAAADPSYAQDVAILRRRHPLMERPRKIVDGVSASDLIGGVATRLLYAPGLSAEEFADEVRLMWPEPADGASLQVYLGSKLVHDGRRAAAPTTHSAAEATGSGAVPLARILAGELAVRVHGGDLIYCRKAGGFAELKAEAARQEREELRQGFVAVMGLGCVVFGLIELGRFVRGERSFFSMAADKTKR